MDYRRLHKVPHVMFLCTPLQRYFIVIDAYVPPKK